MPTHMAIAQLSYPAPCSATPTAVMVGTGLGARLGILIRGGEPLELAKEITSVVFDKTGTLTRGEMVVEDILLLSDRLTEEATGSSAKETSRCDTDEPTSHVLEARRQAIETILYYSASSEQSSEHPIAKAILKKAADIGVGQGLKRTLGKVEQFEAEVGKGVKCTIDNVDIHIGNRRCITANNVQMSPGTEDAMSYLEEMGQTAVAVSINGHTEAVLGIMDRAKDEAAMTVNILQHVFEIKVHMLTGDNIQTARTIARDIGIPATNVIADVLPAEKIEYIKRLKAEGEHVAMVGDGINDSPALAEADVGIAIGTGTQIAHEAAGIVLVNSKLTDLLVAIDLAKTIYNRIKLNFIWALGYNTLAIPIAAGLFYPLTHKALPPYVAAFAMALSSVSVLTSSLSLNRYQPPKFNAKKYGRDVRGGELGVEQIAVSLGDGEQIEFNVKCEGILANMPCSCLSPETCNCTKKSNMRKRGSFPGCGDAWNGTCRCMELYGVCNCLSCTSCGEKVATHS